MPNAQDLMRQRFHELDAEVKAIHAVSDPLRAKRDAIVAKARALELTAAPIEDQIKQAEAGLYEKKNELAMLSRALLGKTALPDA